jgi:hypothetical protein
MSLPKLFREPASRPEIERLAQESFEDMVKFVVDVEREILCAGGGLHADEEQILLDDGSAQAHLWGANYYLFDKTEERFEYTSMINLRPAQGNTAQEIQSPDLRRKVRELAVRYFESSK